MGFGESEMGKAESRRTLIGSEWANEARPREGQRKGER